jgi:glycosyltransferase involved in cell wall biosynthesis
VPSIVADGETGILEDAAAPASAYVERILAQIEDRTKYRQMARAARARFESSLSWDQFAERMVSVIDNNI